MPLRLDAPDSVDALYIDRGRPVEPWRPIIQGDVFDGVSVPGLPAHEKVMVISHPCSMRVAGGQLKPRLQAVPVDPYQHVPLDRWVTGFLRVFPLPELLEDGSHYAARLTEFGMIDTSVLDLGQRIACLSERGILLLQQRFVASLTRVAMATETLDGPCRPGLAEAELLEDWQIDLARPRIEAEPRERDRILAEEASNFDEFVGQPADHPRRNALEDDAGRADVRRQVRAEIARRAAARS